MSNAPAMLRLGAMATFALAVISGDPSDGVAQRGGGRGRGGIQVMALTSSAFNDGGVIPAKYSQAGRDVSPPLAWNGAPDSTVSFVLLFHDADAAVGDGTDDTLHWLVWGIPGTVTSLPEGFPQGMQVPYAAVGIAPPVAARGGRGGRGGAGGGGGRGGISQISVSGPYYRGPAAPASGTPHHYIFELYALDENVNYTPAGQSAGPPTRAAVFEAMQGHIRGKGVLVGTYRRPAP